MKWRINVGKPYLASYEMTRLIARDYVEASAMVKMLLDLLARSEDGTEVITVEPYSDEKEAPDGEDQEQGKKEGTTSFADMLSQKAENVQKL